MIQHMTTHSLRNSCFIDCCNTDRIFNSDGTNICLDYMLSRYAKYAIGRVECCVDTGFIPSVGFVFI